MQYLFRPSPLDRNGVDYVGTVGSRPLNPGKTPLPRDRPQAILPKRKTTLIGLGTEVAGAEGLQDPRWFG